MPTAFFVKVYLPDVIVPIGKYSCSIIEQYTFLRATKDWREKGIAYYQGTFDATGQSRNIAQLSAHIDHQHAVIKGDYIVYSRSYVPPFELFGHFVANLLTEGRITFNDIVMASQAPQDVVKEWIAGKAAPSKSCIGKLQCRLAGFFPDTIGKKRAKRRMNRTGT